MKLLATPLWTIHAVSPCLCLLDSRRTVRHRVLYGHGINVTCVFVTLLRFSPFAHYHIFIVASAFMSPPRWSSPHVQHDETQPNHVSQFLSKLSAIRQASSLSSPDFRSASCATSRIKQVKKLLW